MPGGPARDLPRPCDLIFDIGLRQHGAGSGAGLISGAAQS